ncbi:MAG: tetratricopeptide repeat protein [Myxococcales bacterium]|jgi:tetratricopeptide (TPR) repeat protein
MLQKVLLVLGLGALACGCAAEKVSLAKVAPPEVILETVPTGALVSEGDKQRGMTPLVFSADDAKAIHQLTFTAQGFHPEQLTVSGQDVIEHKGERMLLVMRPDAWAAREPPIDPGDLTRLARAGTTLSRTDRCPEALQFFKRMAQVDPGSAAAYKGMGICYAKMNRRHEALQAYKTYLLVAPNAPDADKVREVVSRAEGDIDIPGRKSEDL